MYGTESTPHLFKARDDEVMLETVERVMEYSMLTSVIARLRQERGYEIVTSHRWKHACETAELTAPP